MNSIIRFFRFLISNIGKITLTLLCVVVFGLLIFPFGDLSDAISTKVLNMTNNQVYIQFDQLHVNPLSPSVNVENLSLETPQINALNIKQLSAQPSLTALIQRQPGGKIIAEGILSGRASIQLLPSPLKDKSGQSLSSLNLSLENISLKDLKESLSLQLPLSGKLSLGSQSHIDLAFNEQPEGDLNLKIQKFEMPTTSINLSEFGSLNLPEIKFSSINLKSKFQSGKYTIENGQLGTPEDEFYGTIKGDIDLIIKNNNGSMSPVVSSYNLSLDLLAKPSFEERASFFLAFISQFQKPEESGKRYKFKLSSSSPGMPPIMTPLQ